jgi:hypothetical protein
MCLFSLVLICTFFSNGENGRHLLHKTANECTGRTLALEKSTHFRKEKKVQIAPTGENNIYEVILAKEW